jgi:hypothetical protein
MRLTMVQDYTQLQYHSCVLSCDVSRVVDVLDAWMPDTNAARSVPVPRP